MTETPKIFRSDDELLASMRASAYEELLFFSNKGKEERERWVVAEFLQHRGIDFLSSELDSPNQRSKTDVHFRGASFQVKEILAPGTKRSDEISANYERLMEATKLEDVIGPQFSYDVPPPTTIYALVSAQASQLAFEEKYRSSKHELDLLFYVTRTNASLVRQEEIDAAALSALGWRSISCLAGSQATVLFAHSNAPSFLHSPNGG